MKWYDEVNYKLEVEYQLGLEDGVFRDVTGSTRTFS